MNSLSDSRKFYDPETASSSGLSHVPCHPMSVPSPCGMLSPGSCLQPTHGTYMVHRETFLKIYLRCRQQLVLEIQEVQQIHIANPCLWTQEDLQHEQTNLRELFNTLQYLHRDLQGSFKLGNPLSHAEGTYPQNCMVEQPRNQVSEVHFDKFP